MQGAWSDRLPSWALLVAASLFLLLIPDTPRRSGPTRAAEQSSFPPDKIHAYTTWNYTGPIGPLQRSAWWQPRACDTTSMTRDGVCMFFTAGTWTEPLASRLGDPSARHPAATGNTSHASEGLAEGRACTVADVLSDPTACVVLANRTLRLTTSVCRLPPSNDAVLRTVLARLKGGRRARLDPSAPGTPVVLAFRGNSLLRSLFYGLIHMLRGLEVGYDRSTHASAVYVATTLGDVLFFLETGRDLRTYDFRRAATELLGGGDLLIYADYRFVCSNASTLLESLEPPALAGYDALLYRCDYTPIPRLPYLHRQQLAEVHTRLRAAARDLHVYLFEGPHVNYQFCWNLLHFCPDERVGLALDMQRKFVARSPASVAREDWRARPVRLIPEAALLAKCDIRPVDGLHYMSVLAPRFPAQASLSKGQPPELDYPTLAHLTWHLVSMTDAGG